jgi:hypothetical protein
MSPIIQDYILDLLKKLAISGLYGITKHPFMILYSFSVLML